MTAALDCRAIGSREELHDALQQALALPEWYGRNLDALHDCLSEGETFLTLRGAESLPERLGAYGEAFLAVLRDAAGENPMFHLTEAPCSAPEDGTA